MADEEIEDAVEGNAFRIPQSGMQAMRANSRSALLTSNDFFPSPSTGGTCRTNNRRFMMNTRIRRSAVVLAAAAVLPL
ncbi:hypothetical protein ABT278_41430, partial [Streptomyces sp. NPDC001228]|uniref:hypothetical protein n=1 Tax=Streptomyces sp. NPDC001228 TaxID=3154381 RepID=UPI003330F9A9